MWLRNISVLAKRCHSSSRGKVASSQKIGIIGAPFNLGQPRKGVENGPRVIRDSGIIGQLQSMGVEVLDKGDVSFSSNSKDIRGPAGEKCLSQILEYNRRLAEAVEQIRREDLFCITLGGDHSTAIGTVTGHSQAHPQKQIVLLWVDAHADINTGETSPTGNMHGMPVSYLLRELSDKVNKQEGSRWPQPSISGNHIVYIGLRDVDQPERDAIEKLGIKHFSMEYVDEIGITETINRSLDHLNPSSDRPLHLAFDIDSLDPLEAPSTGTAFRGGLSLREGLQIVEAARSTSHLRCLDLVELNPSLGSQSDVASTVEAAKAVIMSAVTGFRGSSGFS